MEKGKKGKKSAGEVEEKWSYVSIKVTRTVYEKLRQMATEKSEKLGRRVSITEVLEELLGLR